MNRVDDGVVEPAELARTLRVALGATVGRNSQKSLASDFYMINLIVS